MTNEANRSRVEIEQFKRRVDELKEVNKKISEYETRIALMTQEINRLNEKVSSK